MCKLIVLYNIFKFQLIITSSSEDTDQTYRLEVQCIRVKTFEYKKVLIKIY